MKEKILNYFKYDRSHAGGVALVMELSSRLHLKKQLNIHPESEYMTGVVHEELREIAGISNDELRGMLAEPVQKLNVTVPEPEVKVVDPPVGTTTSGKKTKAPVAPKAAKAPVAPKAAKAPVAPKATKAPVVPKVPAEKKASLKK